MARCTVSFVNFWISSARGGKFDQDPIGDDDQKSPSSFREMMVQLNIIKNELNPYRYNSSTLAWSSFNVS